MNPGVVAGISFAGEVMRYAEVEHEQHGSTLRRLGSCRFDFKIADCLASDPDSPNFQTLAEAVAEIFSGTPAHLLSVALDPRLCYAFETSIAVDADDASLTSQVLKELALVADDETPLFVSTGNTGERTLRDGSILSSISVFALPERTRARLKALAESMGVSLVLSTSVNASSAMIGFLEDVFRGTEAGYSILIGDQGEYAEFAICVDGTRTASALAILEDRADGVYALWSFIRRLGLSPANVDTVYMYGEHEHDSPFRDVARQCGATLRLLSPLDVVRLQAGSGGERDLAVYVPCVGAALETGL